jgi:hypothetical protein
MPEDSCQFFYECEKCKTVLKPKQGDCCVYCSYGQYIALQFKKIKNVARLNRCSFLCFKKTKPTGSGK